MSVPPESSASRALLSAALGGLLCVGLPACTSSSKVSPPDPGSDAATMMEAAAPPFTCDAGVDASAAVVTSSMAIALADMSLATFTTQCDGLSGVVELSTCSGTNSCRGMSYDSETQIMREHTCQGMNTCTGYSCIICD